jgi:antibiotic biosynthesis monooxygenase (ABM) superfamily enzyme
MLLSLLNLKSEILSKMLVTSLINVYQTPAFTLILLKWMQKKKKKKKRKTFLSAF